LATLAGMLAFASAPYVAEAVRRDLARIKKENTPKALQQGVIKTSADHINELIVPLAQSLFHLEEMAKRNYVLQRENGKTDTIDPAFLAHITDYNKEVRQFYNDYTNGVFAKRPEVAEELLRVLMHHPLVQKTHYDMQQKGPLRMMQMQRDLNLYQSETAGQAYLALNFGKYDPQEIAVIYAKPVTGQKEHHFKKTYLLAPGIEADQKTYKSLLQSYAYQMLHRPIEAQGSLDSEFAQEERHALIDTAFGPQKPYSKAVIVEGQDKVLFYNQHEDKLGEMSFTKLLDQSQTSLGKWQLAAFR